MSAKPKQKRLTLYRAYSFKSGEKDPVIDRIHTMLEDEGMDYTKAADVSGVSRSTLVNWIEGETMKPQYCTIAAVAQALGYEMNWTKTGAGVASNVVAKRRRTHHLRTALAHPTTA
jgi:transcriptional regulator with XRE-family HTH domain